MKRQNETKTWDARKMRHTRHTLTLTQTHIKQVQPFHQLLATFSCAASSAYLTIPSHNNNNNRLNRACVLRMQIYQPIRSSQPPNTIKIMPIMRFAYSFSNLLRLHNHFIGNSSKYSLCFRWFWVVQQLIEADIMYFRQATRRNGTNVEHNC